MLNAGIMTGNFEVVVVSDSLIKSRVTAGDNLNLVLKFKEDNVQAVKKYEIEVLSSNSNYDVHLRNAYYEVTPKSVTIKIGNAGSIYGEIPDLSRVSIDKSELLDGDDIDCTLTCGANNKSSIGTYKINGSCVGGNYQSIKV